MREEAGPGAEPAAEEEEEESLAIQVMETEAPADVDVAGAEATPMAMGTRAKEKGMERINQSRVRGQVREQVWLVGQSLPPRAPSRLARESGRRRSQSVLVEG